MGKGLDGTAEENMGACHKRCALHKPPELVSRRTRQRCINRIEMMDRMQTTLQPNETSSSLANNSASIAPAHPILVSSVPIPIDDLAAELEPPPPTHLDDQGDTTMPTWSLSLGGHSFEYGDIDNRYGSEGEAEKSDARVLEAEDEDEESSYGSNPCYDPAMDWSTDIGYTSGSEADIESDIESHPELDDLLPISPVSSGAGSPVVGLDMDEEGDFGPEVPTTPDNPVLGDSNPTLQADPKNPQSDAKLPDALRAFREWVLKLTSDGNLTVAAAESFLKTLNMCLEKDFLRCGSEVDSAHRLPLTLETLRRHVSESPDVTTIYAMCPDFSCQTLKELSLLDLDKPHACAKCKKPITKKKIIRRRGSRKMIYHHVPLFRYAAGSVQQQLRSILERPGILEAIDKHRQYLRRDGRPEDVLEDIQHGELWRNFKKGDTNFFDNPHNIGLILMCDGFSPTTRQGAASYSMTAISLCIANLPLDLRNRPENKILIGVTPGPHEPNVDTINNFLKPMADELLELWNNGMEIKHLDGNSEVIHAALVACACDTPAARKVGGFPGTAARYPCTACWCSHNELHVYDKKFPRRSRKEHKRASKAYKALPNKAQKDKFISGRYEKGQPAGYRYSVLLRLPYWDPSTMVIVDPMHCLFLGLVDFQFHKIWVDMDHLREGKELKELQEMVKSVVRPRHCGRPPAGLGTSVAGSLTSDPLRSLATIDLPLAIPVLWDKVDVESVDQRAHEVWAKQKAAEEKKRAESKKGDKVTRAATKARQNIEGNTQNATEPRKRRRLVQTARLKDQGKRRSGDISNESDSSHSDVRVVENAARTQETDAEQRGLLSWRMQDAEGILLLSSAIKQLCSRTVSREALKTGQEKLMEYLALTAKLRGAERMRPNHHYSTHLPEQIERYGPMSQIWTYSGERLNYDLKSTTSNRHDGGEREMTFATTFHRRNNCVSRLSEIANDKKDMLADWAAYMLQLDHADLRGTAGSETLNSHNKIETCTKRHTPTFLKLSQIDLLHNAFVRAQPDVSIRRASYEHGGSPVLETEVHPIREVRKNGRIFSMSSFRDSIIKANTVEGGTLVQRVGEIVDLWEHHQPTSPNTSIPTTFALVRWYKASPIFAPRSVKLWSEDFPELDVEIYLPNDYLGQQAIIPVSDIQCHCARMSANLDGHPVWLTIGLDRE